MNFCYFVKPQLIQILLTKQVHGLHAVEIQTKLYGSFDLDSIHVFEN